VCVRARRAVGTAAFAAILFPSAVFAFTNARVPLPDVDVLMRVATLLSTPTAALLFVATYFSARRAGRTEHEAKPWTL
jgi:hypothetical protein